MLLVGFKYPHQFQDWDKLIFLSRTVGTAAFGAMWSSLDTFRHISSQAPTGIAVAPNWSLARAALSFVPEPEMPGTEVCWGCTCTQRFPLSEFQSLLDSRLCEGKVWQCLQL